MSLAAIAIAVLWLLIGIVVLAGVIYLAIWVIESFIYPIPERVKQGIWVVVLLLALIALITTLMTGRAPFQLGGRISGVASTAVAALSSSTAADL
jgi:hypothetical protein